MKKRSIDNPRLSEDARRTLRYALENFTRSHRHQGMSWHDNLAAVIEIYENGLITIETKAEGIAVRLT